ncbi:MAG TPA: hypothetical protein DIC30_00270 [Oceanospirillales bacterium]|nr:hypothetical protein [Oleispira sp.]HCM04426.1 hypothetical protein [Oceanospirillales bacterium]
MRTQHTSVKTKFLKSSIAAILLTSGALFTAPSAWSSDTALTSVLEKGEQRADKAVKSQLKIDSIDADIRGAEREYRGVSKEVEGLEVYIKQLNKQLAAQESEKTDIENSIRQVTLIERQITPLMLRMIDALDRFVSADIPFQKTERMARVEMLKDLMGRSDVTVAEKYRKVMDAYQKEMDYGRTIKTYRSTINLAGTEREVDFLRVGRLSLMFLSLDGESLGIWDQQSKEWEPLEGDYKGKLIGALRIAREQAAPSLMKIPVAAPSKSTFTPNSNVAYGEVK